MNFENNFNSKKVLEKESIGSLMRDKLLESLKNNDLDYILNVKEKVDISDFLKDEEVKDELKKAFVNKIEQFDIGGIIKIKNNFDLPEDFVNKHIETAYKKAQEKFISYIKNGYVNDALEIKEAFNLSEEFIQKAAQEGFISHIRNGYVNDAFKIREIFNLPEEFIQEVTQEGFISCIRSGRVNNALETRKAFNLSEEFIQKAPQEGFISCIRSGRVNNALEIKKAFNLSEEFINSLEAQKAVQEGFISCIKNGYVNNTLEIKKAFNLSEEFIQKAAQEGFISCIKNGYVNNTLEIKKAFNLPKEFINSSEIREAAQEGFISCIMSKRVNDALKIRGTFNLSEEFINSSEAQKAAQEGFISCIMSKRVNDALKIKEALNLSEEFIQKVAQEGFISCIKIGLVNDTLEIKEAFNLSEEFINSSEAQKAAQEGFISCIMSKRVNDALEIKEALNLSEEFIQEVAQEGFISCIMSERVNNALEIKEAFNLSEEAIEEKLRGEEEIRKYLELIEQELPEVYASISSSLNKLIPFLEFIHNPEKLITNLKENYFLKNVLMENNKYGPRLISKYLELDEISHKNISSLYIWKEEIMEQNPDINPNSIEFRKLMQDRIAEYENNPETIKAIEIAGINLNKWLNYSKEDTFVLGENEDISTSEQLSQPLSRTLDELLPKYIDLLNQSLREYEKELNNAKILSNEQIKLIDLIERVEEAIEKEKQEGGNKRKIKGMEKGLNANKQKLEKIKDITANKLLQKLINDFNSKKVNIYKLDKELNEAEDILKKEFSKETKVKINQIKEKLQKEINDFLDSFTNFREKELNQILSQALKTKRAESIVQSVEEELYEILNHFDIDTKNIRSIFSPKEKTNDLEGRYMSTRVWDRNPDIDLYQGNYSPCCISIETGCGSSPYESAIADYLTDLAIQIVNIVDKEKQIPVCACWLWLGKDTKEGKPALVIDNIEANTDYSNKYQEQFREQITKYIKNYANSIGIKKIVMRTQYNDVNLTVKEHDNKYIKIGLNNRYDGYYLESEEEMVGELV
jgi:hypothetical protein